MKMKKSFSLLSETFIAREVVAADSFLNRSSFIVCLQLRALCQQKYKQETEQLFKLNEKTNEKSRKKIETLIRTDGIRVFVSGVCFKYKWESDKCMERHLEYFLRRFPKNIAMNKSWSSQLTILPFTCFIFVMLSIFYTLLPSAPLCPSLLLTLSRTRHLVYIRSFRFCFSFSSFSFRPRSFVHASHITCIFGEIIYVFISISGYRCCYNCLVLRRFKLNHFFFALLRRLISAAPAACCVVWLSRAVWVCMSIFVIFRSPGNFSALFSYIFAIPLLLLSICVCWLSAAVFFFSDFLVGLALNHHHSHRVYWQFGPNVWIYLCRRANAYARDLFIRSFPKCFRIVSIFFCSSGVSEFFLLLRNSAENEINEWQAHIRTHTFIQWTLARTLKKYQWTGIQRWTNNEKMAFI